MSNANPSPSGTPPGPKGWPLLGSLSEFHSDPLTFLQRLSREHGDVAVFYLGTIPVYLVSHPELIGQILLKNHKIMHKDEIYRRMKLLGKGLVTSEGELWKKQRKIVSRPFSKKQVDGYAAEMSSIARQWVSELEDGQVRDVHADMMRVTEAIVLKTLFGVDVETDPISVTENIEIYLDQFTAEANGPNRLLPMWVPTPGRVRATAAAKALDEVIYKIIAAKRATPKLGDDVLSRLIVAADEEGGISDEQLRDEAVTLYLAGHETTALALSYTLQHLAKHPQFCAQIRDEVVAVCGEEAPGLQHFDQLRITQAALLESMRLTPPVWAIGREPTEDIRIGDWDLPKGAQIIVSQWVMHHDQRWFQQPNEYLPDRWLDGLRDRLPRFVYLPFGGGPRVCIGNHFAMLEAVLTLANVLHKWRVEPVDAEEPKLMPSITLRPDGPIRLRFSALSKSQG